MTTTYFAIKRYDGHNMSRGPWTVVAITTDRSRAFRLAKDGLFGGHCKVFKADADLVSVYLFLGNKLW